MGKVVTILSLLMMFFTVGTEAKSKVDTKTKKETMVTNIKPLELSERAGVYISTDNKTPAKIITKQGTMVANIKPLTLSERAGVYIGTDNKTPAKIIMIVVDKDGKGKYVYGPYNSSKDISLYSIDIGSYESTDSSFDAQVVIGKNAIRGYTIDFEKETIIGIENTVTNGLALSDIDTTTPIKLIKQNYSR